MGRNFKVSTGKAQWKEGFEPSFHMGMCSRTLSCITCIWGPELHCPRKRTSKEIQFANCLSAPAQIISCASFSNGANGADSITEKDCVQSMVSASGKSVLGQTLERRLEYAIDLEWDSTTVDRRVPDSTDPSSNNKSGADIGLPP